MHALHTTGGVQPTLVHTGQHYDVGMNDVFFAELEFPTGPPVERRLRHARRSDGPGDAGDRAGDRSRAPRHRGRGGRCQLDARCDLGRGQARRSGGSRRGRIAQLRPEHARGDQPRPHRPDRDTAVHHRAQCPGEPRPRRHSRRAGAFRRQRHDRQPEACLPRAVPARDTFAAAGRQDLAEADPGLALLTMHRPSNVDDPKTLGDLLATIREVSEMLPVVFPVHPRTARCIADAGLEAVFHESRIVRLEPRVTSLRSVRCAMRASSSPIPAACRRRPRPGVPCLTLPDQYRAADHHRRGHQRAGRPRPRADPDQDPRHPRDRRQEGPCAGTLGWPQRRAYRGASCAGGAVSRRRSRQPEPWSRRQACSLIAREPLLGRPVLRAEARQGEVPPSGDPNSCRIVAIKASRKPWRGTNPSRGRGHWRTACWPGISESWMALTRKRRPVSRAARSGDRLPDPGHRECGRSGRGGLREQPWRAQ